MPEATDVIRRDHAIMSAMVSALEEMLTHYTLGATIAESDMPGVTNFFLRYADQFHHAKEERILFPAILAADASNQALIDELCTEHHHGREALATQQQAIADGDLECYFQSVRQYLAFIRPHIRRENLVLLPMADRLLSTEQQQALAGRLADLAHEMMPTTEQQDWTEFHKTVKARYKTDATAEASQPE
ncbi:MAG: hemerythrin domain-containing protein [Armatimonadota bacterium]